MNGTAVSFLIGFAPLILLVGLLLLGTYPGEGSIARARRTVDRLLVRATSVSLPDLRLPDSLGTLRGGRLIADSLAGRGPPFAG